MFKESSILIKTNTGWSQVAALYQKLDGEWKILKFYVFQGEE